MKSINHKETLRTASIHGLILLAVFLIPFFMSDYYRMLATESILLAVFAMSLDLILGYAGIASFGHAAFFGAGGYTLGVILKYSFQSLWGALLGAGIVCGAMAFMIGVISIRSQGIYFAILTIAFAEVIYRLVFHTYALGGSDGLMGIPVPDIDFIGLKVNLKKPLNFYYFAAIFAYLSYLVLRRIVDSPFGRVLRGIRDNEHRIPFLGYNIRHYKLIAFVISGVFAGWSGALFSLFKTFADTEQLHFLMSGKVIIMDLIGGLGTLLGPMIGAIFLTVFETAISSYFESHYVITGAMFVFVVIFLPGGLFSLVSRLKRGS